MHRRPLGPGGGEGGDMSWDTLALVILLGIIGALIGVNVLGRAGL